MQYGEDIGTTILFDSAIIELDKFWTEGFNVLYIDKEEEQENEGIIKQRFGGFYGDSNRGTRCG